MYLRTIDQNINMASFHLYKDPLHVGFSLIATVNQIHLVDY